MELKKRLILPNSADVTAVLINDEGEEYPVFLESLHNTILFPVILESGYKLVSLPYGFVKNGVAMDQLPVENYNPTDMEWEQMYAAIGAKLPYDEIKSHLDTTELVGLPLPPTNYTIHTREELLEYLEMTAVANLEDDFMPLNYFVAPEARFGVYEYRSGANAKYTQLITKRREMSLQKFYKLVAWLRQFGLVGANPTIQDVLDGYFAWGFDGLQFVTINRRREARAFSLRTNNNVKAPVIRKTQGFIDGAGNLLTPMHERDVNWQLPSNDAEYIAELTKGLGANDTRVQDFRCHTKMETTILEGTQFNVTYNQDTVICQGNSYTSIAVKSPTEIGQFMDVTLALPHNVDRLFEHCTILALAHMLYTMRKPRYAISSYDALKVAGANPYTALSYVLTKYDINKERKASTTDDEVSNIPAYEVEDYLAGKEVSDSTKSFLEDILNGIFNIDNVGAGKQAEASYSVTSVFNEIYALHYVMGISLQDIYDKFKAITENDRTLTFSNGEYQHVMDVSPMRQVINGYKRDVQNYDIQGADDCSFFTYVTMVAREVGIESCRRHVGIEFYMVNRSNKQVQKLLEELTSMYEEKVSLTIADATRRAMALRMKNVFALSRYFEIALNGTITWSKDLGAGKINATTEQINAARAHLETKIECLTTYCNFTVNSVSASTLTFNAYCTNAYVTPEYVIPRSPVNAIREVPFYTAWLDLQHTNPDIYAQLVAMDVLPQGFVSWSSRYMDQQFKQRSIEEYDSIDSLYHYYESAVNAVHEWPANEEFVSVQHPIDYMFPGTLPEEEEDAVLLTVPRQGEPVIRLGASRKITVEDYKDKLIPTNEIVEPSQYIKAFKGYSAVAYMLCGPDIFNRVPKESPVANITVMAASDSIYVDDIKQVMHFSRLTELDPNKYAYVHVYDRIYLLRATDGKLWEVRI